MFRKLDLPSLVELQDKFKLEDLNDRQLEACRWFLKFLTMKLYLQFPDRIEVLLPPDRHEAYFKTLHLLGFVYFDIEKDAVCLHREVFDQFKMVKREATIEVTCSA